MHKQHRHLVLFMLAQVTFGAHAMEEIQPKNTRKLHTNFQDAFEAIRTKGEASPAPQIYFDTSGTPSQLSQRIQQLRATAHETSTQLASLKAKESSLESTLTPLQKSFLESFKVSSLETDKLTTIAMQQRKLMAEERKLVERERATKRLITHVQEYAQSHPLFKQYASPEIIQLPLQQHLQQEKNNLVAQVALCAKLSKEINQVINPLLKEQTALSERMRPLTDQLSQSKRITTELHEQQLKATAEIAYLESSLVNQLNLLKSAKEKLDDEVAAIRETIEDETDATTKISLRTQLNGKVREVTELSNNIQEAEKSLAASQKSTSLFNWFV